MAGSYCEVQQDMIAHDSNHILSPQPCAPPNKERLLASFETSHRPPSDNGSTIHDTQLPTQDHGYNSSGSSTRNSSSDIFGREMDDELEQMQSRASSRSSLSSMPASVLVHPLNKGNFMSFQEKIAGYTVEDDEASFGGFGEPPISIRTIRQREAAFRKPSSVRAMQMHTEDEAEEDEYLTPPRRRPGMRSPGSSPLKRSPYYSPNTLPKPKAKKEYPLVLLHCNLLAPSLPVSGAAEPKNQGLLEEVLPAPYWKRWRRLQDKVGSGVLRDRGVLISHPEDLYDVLEERLLESLELQRPRVHQGHFIAHEESGPGSEGELSDKGESETDGEQGDECPDCGRRVLRPEDHNRKWEIRVYAANGLMRAGAWAAAWKEMEKVDVEVGVWLPSDVRRTLEKRLAEERQASKDHQLTPVLDEPEKLLTDLQPEIDTEASSRATYVVPKAPIHHVTTANFANKENRHEKVEHEIALQTLVINYIRVLASDKRNIMLVAMSIVVAFLAIGSRPQQQPAQSHVHTYSPKAADLPTASMANVASSSPLAVSWDTPELSIVPTRSLMTEDIVTSSLLWSPAARFTKSLVELVDAGSLDSDLALTSEIAEPEPTPIQSPPDIDLVPSNISDAEVTKTLEPELPTADQLEQPDQTETEDEVYAGTKNVDYTEAGNEQPEEDI